MIQIECPHCTAQYEVDQGYIGQEITCSSCNQRFEVKNPNLNPCPDCFSPISRRARICPHCGAPLREDSPPVARLTGKEKSLEDEQEILVCHPCALNYLWGIILGIILIPVLLIGVLILLYIWIDIHYTVYRITNLRVIIRRGWIAKLQNEIWIRDMRGANLVQDIWQRIIGVGNISLGTAATAGTEICMTGIRNPQYVVDTINSLRNS